MDKRFRKDNSKKHYLDLNPIDRLKLVKERLELYKDLTYAEFKVVFTQDDLFKRLRLDLLYLKDLFYEISKCNINTDVKSINQRDIIIYLFREKTNMKYREIENYFNIFGLNMSYQQISKICCAFDDKFKDKPIIETDLIVPDEIQPQTDDFNE